MTVVTRIHTRPIGYGDEFVVFDIEMTIGTEGPHFHKVELVGNVDAHNVVLESFYVFLLQDLFMTSDTIGVDPFRVGRIFFRNNLLVSRVALGAADGIGMNIGVHKKILPPHFVVASHAVVFV
jgi:hypothetical protein